jgi:hypothetical protein
MSRPTQWTATAVVAVFFLVPILASTASAGSTTRAYFKETGPSGTNMRGVHGTWDAPAESLDIPCPGGGQITTVATYLYGNFDDGTYWMKVGNQYTQTEGSPCGAIEKDNFWEYLSYAGYYGSLVSFNSGVHDYALTRVDTGCGGANYCWRLRIDGGSVLDVPCCYSDEAVAPYAHLDVGRVGMYCTRTSGGQNADCPATAKTDTQHSLTLKRADNGNWIDWSGKEDACVDYAQEARGKWISDTSVLDGFNIAMANSLTTC